MRAALRHLAKLRFLLLACALLAGCSSDKPPHTFAYITGGKSNSVTVINATTGGGFHVIAQIPVGRNPTGIAVSPTRDELYVVNTESNNVSFIDARTLRVVATVGVHRAPYCISVSHDGHRGYVANSGSANVAVLDLDNRKLLGVVGVGAKPGLAQVSPDGATVVVSNFGGNSVSIMDAAALRVRATIPVCNSPTDIVVLPDSSKAFIACPASNQVAAVALKGEKHSDDRLLALLDVGQNPVSLALKPDGGELFVTNYAGQSFSVIETTANEVSGTYMIGGNPAHAVATSDNSLLYVSNFGTNSVGVFSINDGRVIDSVGVGGAPDSLALTADENFLLVADSRAGDVAVIRTTRLPSTHRKNNADRALMTLVPVGAQPNAIAIKTLD